MFSPVGSCWVCGGTSLRRYHEDRFDFMNFAAQAPDLHEYTGRTVWLVRCAACGHGQPEQLPTLPRFFDRMYDQRWDDRWIEQEFSGHSKDLIFRGILRELKTGTIHPQMFQVGTGHPQDRLLPHRRHL